MRPLGSYYGLGLEETIVVDGKRMTPSEYNAYKDKKAKESNEAKIRAGEAVVEAGVTLYSSYQNAKAQVEMAKAQGKSAVEIARLQAEADVAKRQMELQAEKEGKGKETPKWILPVAIGGGVLFLLMMMMVMIKRNPKLV